MGDQQYPMVDPVGSHCGNAGSLGCPEGSQWIQRGPNEDPVASNWSGVGAQGCPEDPPLGAVDSDGGQVGSHDDPVGSPQWSSRFPFDSAGRPGGPCSCPVASHGGLVDPHGRPVGPLGSGGTP